jgi:beta-xylosidase
VKLARPVVLALVACALGCSSESDGSSEDALSGAYTNPVIRMYDRPAGVASDLPKGFAHQDTEGCPDPQGLKTKSGEYYIYCTSYTWRYERLNGFPIFKSDSHTLSGPWSPVGSIIRDVDGSRQAWPGWVRDKNNDHTDGDFWGPDVHELPNGKFVAEYSAPCGSNRCVGIAWSDSPDGPFTHDASPFVDASNNTDTSPGGDSYDPSLLVASSGNYLYWVVPGRGVYGVQVDFDGSGKLSRHASSSVFRIADRTKGQVGEGPYVVEHDGHFYEFYSSGSLLYSYYVGVRRGDAPDAPFTDEGPLVVQRNSTFVATGGNSIIQDAVSGKDVMVYHAIVVPSGGGCPRENPEFGGDVKPVAVNQGGANPHCRVQGDRQAMIDPLEWKVAPDGKEWPRLANGTTNPTVGKGHL